jgi:hypothetical protein
MLSGQHRGSGQVIVPYLDLLVRHGYTESAGDAARRARYAGAEAS